MESECSIQQHATATRVEADKSNELRNFDH